MLLVELLLEAFDMAIDARHNNPAGLIIPWFLRKKGAFGTH